MTLSCCDTSVLLSMFLLVLSTSPHLSLDSNFLTKLLPHFTYPVVHIATTASTIMTVALAHERYLAVQAPIVYSQMLKRSSAQRRRLAMHVLPVLLFAICFNMPTFWCVENTCKPLKDINPQTTIGEHTSVQGLISNISGNDHFEKSITSQTVTEMSHSTVPMLGSYISTEGQELNYNILKQGNSRPDLNEFTITSKQHDLFPAATITKEDNDKENVTLDAEKESTEKDCETFDYRFTEFRSHPYFIMFYQNIARLVILGIIPFAMLIFFNCSIYLAIRRRTGMLVR